MKSADKILGLILAILLLTTTVNAITDTNLTAYYKLDETSGTTAIDYKLFDNNGTNIDSAPINAIGKINKAYGQFYANDYIDLGSSTTNISRVKFAYNEPFTVCGWIYNYAQNGQPHVIIGSYGTVDSTLTFELGIDNTKKAYMSRSVRGVAAYIATGTTNVDNNVWTFICGSHDGTNSATGIKVWVNTINDANAQYSGGAVAAGNNPTAIGNNVFNKASFYFNGRIDEVSIWNKTLSATDVNELYNGGAGLTYPFKGISVDFNYVIRKDLNQILLKDTSVATDVTKTTWTWKANGTTISTAQDFNYTALQLTDYNICLHVDTNQSDANGDKCYQFNTDDWTPPTTTFSSTQYTNETKQKLTFVCTDNNSGCKYLNYNIDSNVWIQVANTGTKDINYSGAGSHSIQYFSTDNSDNNETTKTGLFTTYGNARFTIKDENSGLDLNGTQINFNGSDYVSGSNVYDFNLQGLTTGEYTFTITKTGYSTRYYIANLTQLTDLNVQFALIPNTIDVDVPFKVYQTDQSTIYANTFVELKDKDTNYTIGRQKTNSVGELTFNLRADDSNYWTIVDNGAFTYSPVTVTIKYPKNEQTLVQIIEKWKIEITQNLYASYTDLNADKIVYLLPNTSLPYNIKISDMNNNYFSRTYAKTYPGNPLTDTLQPYLVSTSTGLLTTITTKDASTNTAVPNVTIKIFKYISGLGRTLVEQLNTDSKGQALALLVLNGEYEFETYLGATFIKTYNITATSSTIIIYLYSSSIPADVNASGYNATFTPISTGINKLNVGTATFTTTIFNYGAINTTYIVTLIQNGVTLDSETYTGNDLNKTFTLTRAWADINKGTIQVRIVTGTGYGFQQTYNIVDSFGTNYSILNGLQNGLRSDIGCPTNGVCFPLMIIGILISIGLVLYASMLMGGFNGQASGLIFVISMILFAYLNWIPYELIIALVLIVLAFIVNERRN